MKPYIVTFFKHVLSSDGHDFNALQEKIGICADTPGQALEAAQQRFASLRGIPDWRSHADSVKIAVDLRGRGTRRLAMPADATPLSRKHC